MSEIHIDHVSRHFDDNIALADVSLTIKEGEFFSLLGPSGCGKSTLLNIIAGFLEPTDGVVHISGKDVTNLPPYRRNLGMVFQNYALFPHLTVFENIAYGLKIKKMSRQEIKERVEESLALVQLEQFAGRRPHQLSGGQQQRVAIARALAVRPSVLLLDEPLSNLDAKLRKEMQFELRNIQQRVGITTILVTHDQEEALSLSDRVGILGKGRLQQVGTPLEVYRAPANQFVAEFIGQVNLFEVALSQTNQPSPAGEISYEAISHMDGNIQPLALAATQKPEFKNGQALFMLRPERIQLAFVPLDLTANYAETRLLEMSYVGNALRLKVALAKGELVIHTPDPMFAELPKPGDVLYVYWNPEDLYALEAGE
ncbi:ABC transporter ATP-binding protein [Planomicrobium sp. CPCC 101110]|uniref:ABC transporter ATP-binding protein n=1 Tax=Planomicrobium sp. CPCC 101110 TaxID=2599619 RepID=UPI0011B357B9|nr:ABC transporter ATP-binding protein [Planomicrobium sp. CPCC 101110]TWT25783.1 ABC transporter ATP-binding protein [Planomicrobium sp. CPCC 101110]